MDSIFFYICEHAHYAEYILFFLLMLAGFNVPVSEDLIIITGGALVSVCLHDHYLRVYLWVYAGSWLSAWVAYWIGRIYGPKLYEIKWFNWAVTPKRIEKLHSYYERFGIWTFIVGRFFPGGIRNALFITCGMGKMPFPIFILRDGIAALISTNLLFYLGYIFGQNYHLIVHYIITYNQIFIGILLAGITLLMITIWIRHKKKT